MRPIHFIKYCQRRIAKQGNESSWHSITSRTNGPTPTMRTFCSQRQHHPAVTRMQQQQRGHVNYEESSRTNILLNDRFILLLGALAGSAFFSSTLLSHNLEGSSPTRLEQNINDSTIDDEDIKLERILQESIHKKRVRSTKRMEKYEESQLPRDDPETTSELCNSYRKGPCRAVWRQLEWCIRDNGKTNLCDVYIPAVQECLQIHQHLYELIALDTKQTQARDIELDYRFDDKGSLENIQINWQGWYDFLKQEGSLERVKADYAGWNSLDKFVPYYKRFIILEKNAPELVTVQAVIPSVRNGKPLQNVYCLDQDGLLLGILNVESTISKDQSSTLNLSIVPGMTLSITLKALYKENGASHPNKKPYQYDAILCTSGEIELEKIAEQVVPMEDPSKTR